VNEIYQDLTRRRAGMRQMVWRRYFVVTAWAVLLELTADTDGGWAPFAWAECCMHFATKRRQVRF
jgi:hypothetical protein